jgi:hypothetical protein
MVAGQFYYSDRLRFRLEALYSSYPDQGLVDFLGDGGDDQLALEANTYSSINLHPGVFYTVAQYGEASSAVLLQAGGMVLASVSPEASDYKEVVESYHVSLEGNGSTVYAYPSAGVSYVSNFEDSSIEVELLVGPAIPVWGDSSFGVAEIDGVEYEGRDMMALSFNGLLQLEYRWQRLLAIVGVNYFKSGLSALKKEHCAHSSDVDDSYCNPQADIFPIVVIGVSFGPWK